MMEENPPTADTNMALLLRTVFNEAVRFAYPRKVPAPAFVEEIKFQGERYTKDGDFRVLTLLLNRPTYTKFWEDDPSPALMYIHGGGGIALDARYADECCQRWADESGIVVFNLEYRLAPETPAPGGIMDCYAGLKYIIDNAWKYDVDPKRVTFSGESGGGYLAMGLGMELSKRGESDLVPFIMGSATMVGGQLFEMTEEDMAKGYDDPQSMQLFMGGMVNALAGVPFGTPYEQIKDRVDVFITNMPEEILKNFPPTVLWTSEYDSCRWGTEVMAQLLEKHGKLLDYIVHPGVEHCWYFADVFHKSPSTQKFWDDNVTVLKKYLQ
jgi:acetyl esterase/lipase